MFLKPKVANLVAIGFLVFLVTVFFWKVLFKGLVPFPGDLLVGAYYPWLEYKWGYSVGVPVKNGLISDVFSEMYVWKHLVIDSFKIGQWPLWNPYSYSGYPLLANFSSGALYIFNSLLLLGIKGWSTMIMIQVAGTAIGMYCFLILRKYGKVAALGGAIAFAFSASMMGRLEWNSAGHVTMWLTVTLALLEYYFEKNRRAILLLPVAIFLMITAGHFQTMLYSFLIIGLFTLHKLILKKNKAITFEIVLFSFFGLCLSAIQLLPTISMMNQSIRFSEGAVDRDNFGLLPAANLITMIAPDFFGNPATANFWGFLNYSETIFYPGILGFAALLWGVFNYKKLTDLPKISLLLGIITILMAFDNTIGKLIYILKVPFLSTGYAARIAVVLMFTTSILISEWLERLPKMKLKEAVFPFMAILLFLIPGYLIPKYSITVFSADAALMTSWLANMTVAIRNLVLPGLLTAGLLFLVIFRKFRIVTFFILGLLVADQFRFGWKYNPFVSSEFVYPNTAVTDFLKSQPGYFRVDSSSGPILPAQTWSMFGLYSASGYDPLVGSEYASEYSRQLNQSEGASRYSLLGRYGGKDMGEYNIKYLLTDRDNFKIQESFSDNWTKDFETDKITIFRNKEFKERAEWLGSGQGEAKIDLYTPNSVSIIYTADSDGEIVLRDSWASGWIATVNGITQPISKYRNVFRIVKVPAGTGILLMDYRPREWQVGKLLFYVGVLAWVSGGVYIIKHNKYEKA